MLKKIFRFLLRKIKKMAKKISGKFRNTFGIYDSESKLASDAQDYWRRDYSKKENLAQDAHWKNKGIFQDTNRWLSLGKEHLDLIMQYASVCNLDFPVNKIVEWGCGGGANAVHFAKYTKEYIGIEITQESLNECKSQLVAYGFNNFKPVLINVDTPETINQYKITNVDFFLCTYVYELLPSPSYGIKILQLAFDMLKTGGVALIQIRYHDGIKNLKSRKWDYKSNPYLMTTYTIEEFWNQSVEIGFTPLGIYLKPVQPLVNDFQYAYYFLRK